MHWCQHHRRRSRLVLVAKTLACYSARSFRSGNWFCRCTDWTEASAGRVIERDSKQITTIAAMQLQRAPLTRNSDGVLRCAAQKQPQSGSSSRPRRKQQSVLLRAATEKASKKSSYPEEELELDGFLPLRKPGAALR